MKIIKVIIKIFQNLLDGIMGFISPFFVMPTIARKCQIKGLRFPMFDDSKFKKLIKRHRTFYLLAACPFATEFSMTVNMIGLLTLFYGIVTKNGMHQIWNNGMIIFCFSIITNAMSGFYELVRHELKVNY